MQDPKEKEIPPTDDATGTSASNQLSHFHTKEER